MSLAEVAERSGLARSYLYKLLSGQVADPSIRSLSRLAAAVQIPPIVLFRAFMPEQPSKRAAARTVFASRLDPADRISFADDLTIPDHSVMGPGERFTKTWCVCNSGTKPWPARHLRRADRELVIATRRPDGSLEALLDAHLDALGHEVSIPPVAPNHSTEISVEFQAPMESCSVCSVWRIHAEPQGWVYPQFFLQVIVTVIAA